MEEDNDNDYEYHLNDPGEIKQQIKSYQLKTKIITGLIIFLIILFIGVFGFFIYYFIIRKNDDKKDNNSQPNSNTNKVFNFSSLINVKYGDDVNKIENTFKINGSNYNETFGNINQGKDYALNPSKNIYDLYIPKNLNKTQYNKILLLIHGGFWTMGDKSAFTFLCQDLANQRYITASMAYSLLNSTNYNSSIFRILDEVASAIKSIKKTLKEKGFNEAKLELAIGGASSGAQIALLYAYLYRNSTIPIKFAINLVGPVTPNNTYYYQLKDPNKPLDSIDQESIDKAIKETTIEPIKQALNSSNPMELVNLFLGYKHNEITMQDKRCLHLLITFQMLFPIVYADKKVVPTLCLYTGKDMVVGVRQYSYFKSIFANKNKIDLQYCKNLPHEMYVEGSSDTKECFSGLYKKISNFSNEYFSKNK